MTEQLEEEPYEVIEEIYRVANKKGLKVKITKIIKVSNCKIIGMKKEYYMEKEVTNPE